MSYLVMVISLEHMLQLYNTKTRRKEEFKPLIENYVGLYSCGPTVYNYAHIGNLRSYVFVDTLKRTLQFFGYKVTHVMNITDVGHLVSEADTGEDKMEKGARREGKSAWNIAKFYIKAFQEDLVRLHIIFPDIFCKATDHIKEQISLIQKLEEKGYVYRVDDGMYFDTSRFPAYADFARLDLEHLVEGARVETVHGKKNGADFSLWKFSPKDKKRDMEWDSPWGKGFPGWHIECSAMSIKYLGDRFDIHTGGIDHIPVHHTNEIAQNNAALGHEVVTTWMENEFVVVGDSEKMAKSSENFLTLQRVIDRGYEPMVYRFFLLNSHYRAQVNFSWEALEGAKEGLQRLRQFVRILREKQLQTTTSDVAEAILTSKEQQFRAAMEDDLNTPQALAVVFALVREINKEIQINKLLPYHAILGLLSSFDMLLGLNLDEINISSEELPEEIKQLLEQRQQARIDKNWVLSDALRQKIDSLGYSVEDTASEQRVIKK